MSQVTPCRSIFFWLSFWAAFPIECGVFVNPSETLDLVRDWRFAPDPSEKGEQAGWFTADFDDGPWAVLDAGKRWEDQGFPEVDGYAWYRKWVDIPATWEGKSVWLAFGGMNDGCVLYCNGERVQSYGEEPDHSAANSPILADLSPFLNFGQPNLIALQVLDWGGSGGPWRLPCVVTTDPEQIPNVPEIRPLISYEDSKLWVEADLLGLGNEIGELKARMELTSPSQADFREEWSGTVRAGDRLIEASFALPQNLDTQADQPVEKGSPKSNPRSPETHFPGFPAQSPASELPGYAFSTGRYRLKVSFAGGQGAVPARTVEVERAAAPAWTGEGVSLQVLNNFVTVLAEIQAKDEGRQTLEFLNPREGWVFFSVRNLPEGIRSDEVSVALEGEEEALVWRIEPSSGDWEAMWFLPEGKTRARVSLPMGARLSVRTVPEIAYTYYPCTANLAVHGPFDWPYLEKYVLSQVNTLVTSGVSDETILESWRREGRKWIGNSSLPGLGGSAPTTEEVYKVWAANPGVTDHRYEGIIVDEFLGSTPDHYRAWTEAVERLTQAPDFQGKRFYAFCLDLFSILDERTSHFCRTLARLDHRFAVEKYLPEVPTEKEAKRLLLRDLQQTQSGWTALIPDWQRRHVVCLGYLSAPPESLNINPAVDYKVFLDMQFHLLANDPTFWGLFGIMVYTTSYADEEIVRWTHRLIRHYCIEGNRARFSDDPYELPHLENPDFEKGLEGWRVEPAVPGSIVAGEREGWSWLQGRYPRSSRGDHFAVLRRSAERPNRLRQSIRSLQPGRLYSLKLLSGDLNRLKVKQDLAVAIEIGEAEILEGHSFQTAYPSCYSHEHGPFNREHPAHYNYHRIVFRPKTDRAQLIVSDWRDATAPGGPAGQELALNFVEVQPFLEP